jgi:hypothetical protein
MRRRSSRKVRKDGALPRWFLIAGGVAAALLAYVGARGGPGHAWKETKEAFGIISPPEIVSLRPRPSDQKTFVVAIRNPSLKRIEVTGVEVAPATQFLSASTAEGAGALPVVKSEQGGAPRDCDQPYEIAIVTPLVIEAQSSGGLEVTPWRQECDFGVKVVATSGTSEEAFWTPRMNALLEQLEREAPELYNHLQNSRQLPRN